MPLALIETELIQSHGIFEFFSRKNDLFHTTEKEPNKCDNYRYANYATESKASGHKRDGMCCVIEKDLIAAMEDRMSNHSINGKQLEDVLH